MAYHPARFGVEAAAWRDFARVRHHRAVRVGRNNVGNIVEQDARLALFIDGLKQSGRPEAAARVKQALFDYSDLGAWEAASARSSLSGWSRERCRCRSWR